MQNLVPASADARGAGQMFAGFDPTGQEVFVGVNLDRIGPAEFAQIKGKLKGVQDRVLYDSIRCKAATSWSPKKVQLFQSPLNQPAGMFNSPTDTYSKSYTDTNLEGNGGSLPKGQNMVVQSIQVDITAPASLNTANLANGSTINPARSTDASVENTLVAIRNSLYMRFIRDRQILEEGLVKFYPSESGISGFAGVTQTGVVNNGMGRPRYLSRVRRLEELQPFYIELELVNTITTPPQEFLVQVALVGTLYTPVA